MADISHPRLDALYKLVAHIYGDKLSSRTSAATFSHLVREGLDVTDALCKALAWYFPLLAKFKIRSVEALVFRKFPLVCPYCREAPHNEPKCKLWASIWARIDDTYSRCPSFEDCPDLLPSLDVVAGLEVRFA
jgi:hypothetical protein